ncbi:5445_t:CDS:2, partial [Scutellospora calospora]
TPSTPENNTPNISREQGLIQELSTSIKEQAQSIISPEINHTIKISENNVRPNCDNSRITRDSETQDIICLYQNACNAEKDAIEANQKEILCWCFYAKRFKSMVKDFMINDRIEFIDNSSDNLLETEINEEAKRILSETEDIKSLPETEISISAKSISKEPETVNIFNKYNEND